MASGQRRTHYSEPNGSVSNDRRPRFRSPRRPDPPRRPRTARFRPRDDQRARRAVRHVADRDEEAHPAARGGAARDDGEGRPCPQVHACALRLRGHQHVAAAARPLRAGRRTHERRPMNTTTVTTPNELEIRVERIFDAPRAHVFSVWTDAKQIPEWWGDGTVVEGEFREIDAPERFVQTFQNHLQTLEFEDLGDRTKLTQTMRFATTEERDTTMQYGVEEGAKGGFARVDALLQRLPLDA